MSGRSEHLSNMATHASLDWNRADPSHHEPYRLAMLTVPRVHTSFVGRAHELGTLRQMIRNPALRVITITGPGGVGKTRLCIEVAGTLERVFGRNIWFVALAPVGNAALVPAAIARAIGVRESGTRSIVHDIVEFLSHRPALLLIDNFERLTDASGAIAELVAACPQLTVLATSQAPLRLQGEQEFSLAPLMLSPVHHPRADVDTLDAAVQLFVDRAKAVLPAFELNDGNRDAVEEICRELDGLPLAIELAAARVRVLSPSTICTLMQNDRQAQFQLLRGGPRDAPERHQSLSEAIGWSYRLLDEHEQRLFRWLSVFQGGFTLEAVEAIGELRGPQDRGPATFDLLASLVDKSLLMSRAFGPEEPGFLMLSSIRAFAAELLDAVDEADEIRDWHASYFLRRADAGEYGLRGREQRTWLGRLDVDHENLLAALRRLEATREGARLQCMVWALFWYWFFRGYTQEARFWLERACTFDEGSNLPIDLWVRCGDAMLTNHVGDYADGLRRARVAAELARSQGNAIVESMALIHAQYSTFALGRLEESREYGWEAHRLMANVDDDYWRAMAFGEAGIFLAAAGDTTEGLAMLEAALELERARGDEYFAGIRLSDIGVIRHDLGELDGALARYGESIEALGRVGGVWYLASPFRGIASLLAESRPTEAAQLLGAAQALHDLGGANPWATEIQRNALALERARAALGDVAFERAFQTGYDLPVEDVEEIARSLVEQQQAVAASRQALTVALTPRELEVLELIAAGMTDREIGAALSISDRTASKHVANILGKLEASTRAEAVARTRMRTGGDASPMIAEQG